MSPDVPRARRLVEARLGRPPQDALEAAVVLEAWAGVPAQRALETARALMPVKPAAALVSASVGVAPARPRGLLLEGVAFLITVVAIALWAAPLSAALGVESVERALRIALPVTVGLQWALQARHLGRPSGLSGLAGGGRGLAFVALAVIGLLAVVADRSGLLAGLLIVIWTCGSILIRRGWAAVYGVTVAAAVPVLLAGAGALLVIGAVAAVTVGAAALALRTTAPVATTPGRWSRTLGAGLTGAGLGLLLVGDPTVAWTSGADAALALLPSAAGAVWAGQHLWKLAGAFPRALAGVPACPRDERALGADRATRRAAMTRADRGGGRAAPRAATRRPVRGGGRAALLAIARPRRSLAASTRAAVIDRTMAYSTSARATHHSRGGSPSGLLLGALTRFAALTVAGSAVLLVAAPAGVLAGFGVVALATLVVGLLDSLGRPSLAALGVAAGLAAEALVRLVGVPFAGGALLAAGLCAVAVVVPAALVLLARPARTLATTLWIT